MIPVILKLNNKYNSVYLVKNSSNWNIVTKKNRNYFVNVQSNVHYKGGG